MVPCFRFVFLLYLSCVLPAAVIARVVPEPAKDPRASLLYPPYLNNSRTGKEIEISALLSERGCHPDSTFDAFFSESRRRFLPPVQQPSPAFVELYNGNLELLAYINERRWTEKLCAGSTLEGLSMIPFCGEFKAEETLEFASMSILNSTLVRYGLYSVIQFARDLHQLNGGDCIVMCGDRYISVLCQSFVKLSAFLMDGIVQLQISPENRQPPKTPIALSKEKEEDETVSLGGNPAIAETGAAPPPANEPSAPDTNPGSAGSNNMGRPIFHFNPPDQAPQGTLPSVSPPSESSGISENALNKALLNYLQTHPEMIKDYLSAKPHGNGEPGRLTLTPTPVPAGGSALVPPPVPAGGPETQRVSVSAEDHHESVSIIAPGADQAPETIVQVLPADDQQGPDFASDNQVSPAVANDNQIPPGNTDSNGVPVIGYQDPGTTAPHGSVTNDQQQEEEEEEEEEPDNSVTPHPPDDDEAEEQYYKQQLDIINDNENDDDDDDDGDESLERVFGDIRDFEESRKSFPDSHFNDEEEPSIDTQNPEVKPPQIPADPKPPNKTTDLAEPPTPPTTDSAAGLQVAESVLVEEEEEEEEEDEKRGGYDSLHFFSIFLVLAFITVGAYLLFHNKKSLKENMRGYMGENGKRRRTRGAYKPLLSGKQ